MDTLRNGVERHSQLSELRQRTARFANDARFVEQVMTLVTDRELGALVSRAARRCIGVCGFIVVVAVWWAMQSRELVPFVYLATQSPMEGAW